LWNQSDPACQVYETWIGAQAVEFLLDLEVHQPDCAFLVSFLEPGECLILFVKAGIDRGDLERRDVPALSELLQFDDYFLRRLSVPRHRIRMGEVCHGDRASSTYRLLELGNCLGIPAFLLKD